MKFKSPIRLFARYELKYVFTPSTIAKLTYIKRETIETDVEKYIEIPGMQLILFGHSGCGKSTLICNKLDELKIRYIKTSCQSDTTLNDLIFSAFDQLNVFFDSSKSFNRKSSIQSEISAKYKEIGSLLSFEMTNEESLTKQRALPLQLTPQRLTEFLGAANCLWIIEDFHKVIDTEKKKIADIMKIFMDSATEHPNVKIICIGAVGTARELIELDSNLSNRVTETFIPLLRNAELEMIVDQGFSLVNIKCDKTLKEKIIYYSNNLASVCHQICYDICHNRSMKKTNIFCKQIDENDFKNAVASYVRKNSDTFSKIFDKTFLKKERKIILESIINIEKDSVSSEELYKEINKIKKVNYETFTKSLEDLISSEYDEVLRIDRNSKRYFYSNPFFQAFVKMKLALEDLEKNKKHKKGISDFPLVDVSSIKDFTFNWANDEKVLESFYVSLEDTYKKKLITYKLIENRQKYSTKKRKHTVNKTKRKR